MDFSHLELALGGSQELITLYLRDYELRYKKNPDTQYHAKAETQQILQESLLHGKKLVLSIDDMPAERVKEWREIYDPDL